MGHTPGHHSPGYGFKVAATDEGQFDVVMNGGRVDFVSGTAETIQAIVMRLHTHLGNSPVDPNFGVPWHLIILSQSETFARSEIIGALRNEPRIKSIDKVDASIRPDDSVSSGILEVSIALTLVSGEKVNIREIFGI